MTGSIDLEVAEWMAGHRNDTVTRMCRLLEDLGQSLLFVGLLALVGLAVVLFYRAWWGLPCVAMAMLVTSYINGPLKEIIDRPRPPANLALTTLNESAMPSSHAVLTASAVVAVAMAPWWTSRVAQRVVAVVGAFGCLVVGAAMIYLGGHWLSDVLVGWALGAGLAGGSSVLWKRWGLWGADRKPVRRRPVGGGR